MRRISLNGQLHALPFEKLFRPHTTSEANAVRESIAQLWVQAAVIIYTSPTHGRSIIDGGNRTEYATELDTERPIPVDDRGDISDDTARAIAETLNYNRRQFTPEEMREIRRQQELQAVELRKLGKSYRDISDRTGLTHSATYRLLTGDTGVSSETPDEPEYPPARIEGRDGKSYLAARAPVIVAKVPPGLDRDAALIEAAKVRKQAAALGASMAELLRGPLKRDYRKVGLAWEKFTAELEAVEAA